jgi:hypothetical protein
MDDETKPTCPSEIPEEENLEMLNDYSGLFFENYLLSSNGERFKVDDSLWKKCGRLEKISARENFANLRAHANLILGVIKYHKEKDLSFIDTNNSPVTYEQFFEFMALAITIDYKDLRRDNLKFLLTYFEDNLSRFCFTEDCVSNGVIQIFEEILTLPLRTSAVYEPLIMKVKEWPRIGEVEMNNIYNLLRTKQLKLLSLKITTRLDEPFKTKGIPLAIMNDFKNNPHLMMWSSNCWIQADLFGTSLDLKKTVIKNFFLRYSKYVVYQSKDHKVFFRSLLYPGDSKLLVTSCTDFKATLTTYCIKVIPPTNGSLRGLEN